MAKHTRNLSTNCLSVFGHFVGLALKGLRVTDVLYGADGHVLKFDIYQGTVALNCCKSHKHS